MTAPNSTDDIDNILNDLRSDIEWCIDPQRLSGVYVDRDKATKSVARAKAAIQAEMQRQVLESNIALLDEFTRRWNNFIGDMPDKEKEKLTYLEITGMIWGIAAQFRIPLEQALQQGDK